MPVNFLQKQEGGHAPMSCARASALGYRVRNSVKYQAISDEDQKQRRTAENAKAPRCSFRHVVVQDSRISAEEDRSAAVNLREEQRKQRRRPPGHFVPKQCSGPGKRRARTS